MDVRPVYPRMLWNLWLSSSNERNAPIAMSRLHVYDVYNNHLTELSEPPPESCRSIFADFYDQNASYGLHSIIRLAETEFVRLQDTVEATLSMMLDCLAEDPLSEHRRRRVHIANTIENECIRKYFAFLRFRNSSAYKELLDTCPNPDYDCPSELFLKNQYACILQPMHHLWARCILQTFISFLQQNASLKSNYRKKQGSSQASLWQKDKLTMVMDEYCWRFVDADIHIGTAAPGQDFEFVTSSVGFCCLGDGDGLSFFTPLSANLCLYMFAEDRPIESPPDDSETSAINIQLETISDVYLRNGLILHSHPQFLYITSLRSAALSVSSYSELKWPTKVDYTQLKQRCRQKHLQETVTKTLLVRGSLNVTDLTHEIAKIGRDPVEHGTFSDVWKGCWMDPAERKPRIVALKILRKVMVQNVREKLMRRLQQEVVAWHSLCHRNLSQFLGIYQSRNSIGLVSPWYEYGHVGKYLKEYPKMNRFELMVQIASGIEYLHGLTPAVIHGDLKSGNILVDRHGQAIIADFGLSKVVENMSDDTDLASSFFAGSSRWMAFELVQSLVNDDGRVPTITTSSDVFAFASVCLEIATGRLPYPLKTNDHSVTLAILLSVKPNEGITESIIPLTNAEFWAILEDCWDINPDGRPGISYVLHRLKPFQWR